MKRLREFFESIAYFGLKPSGQKTTDRSLRWLGPLAGPVDRFLSGGPAPNDPLYLTNRSSAQKLRFWLLLAIPCLILAGAIGLALSNILDPPETKPAAELSSKELAAKILPSIDPNMKFDQNNEIEAVEVRVEHTGAARVTGIVRNTTNHDIALAHMIIDLTDMNGSQVGGVEAHIENIPASKTKTFSVNIAQTAAAFALVREVGPGR